MAKFSRALQTKHLDLSLISSLVDATLNSLNDAILSSANWVLQLQDAREELKAATDIEVTHLDICFFEERVGKPFIRLIKNNISSRFRSSSKAVYQPSVFLIQRKVPSLSTHELPLYGDSSIQTPIGQIYQLYHWNLNLRRQPLSLLISSRSGKRIVSSLLSSQKMLYLCN